MLVQTWGEVFSNSLKGLWTGFMGFVPNLIVAIIVFIVGWVIGSVISKVLTQLVGALKLDKLFQNAGAEEILNRAGVKLNVGKFIGELARWFIIIVFLMTALEIVGLKQVNDFLREVVIGYLPQVIIAALVLIFATIIADFIKKVVTGSAKAANIRSANFLGTVAKYAIWIFALIIALSELGIAAQFMQILFTGIIATIAISLGLAFGLGGKDMAARSLEKMKEQVKNHNSQE